MGSKRSTLNRREIHIKYFKNFNGKVYFGELGVDG